MELSLDFNRQYTYADYLTWADDKMRELLNGFIRMMSPAPTLKHAIVSSRLSNKIFNYIERKRGNCQVFYAPFDVCLPKNPKEKGINVFILQDNGKYDEGTVYECNTQVPMQTLEGLSIDAEALFKD